MLHTVVLGSCVSVQGVYVRTIEDGRVTVRVDRTEFTGVLVAMSPQNPARVA